jgi:ADP-ribose pyrophosphatase
MIAVPATTPQDHPVPLAVPAVTDERVLSVTADGKTTVREVDITFGNLSWTQRIVRNVGGGFPGAMAVTTRRGDGAILFIRTYRHPVGKHCWELPSGRSESADMVAEAERELVEETGYTPATPGTFLGYLVALPGRIGGVQSATWFEVADDAVPADIDHEASAVAWFTRDTIDDMILDGTLRCSASIAALATYDAYARVAARAKAALAVAA